MSSVYVNNEDTLGFYKFTDQNDLLKNSIVNSNLSPIKFISMPSTNIAILLPTNLDYPARYTNKYKSRGSSLLLKESNGIMIDNIGYGSNLTTEFWVYPKKLDNSPNDIENYRKIIEGDIKQNTGNLNNASISTFLQLHESNPFLYVFSPISPAEYSTNSSGHSGGLSTSYYTYHFPVWIILSYCSINKRFIISTINKRIYQNGSSYWKGYEINTRICNGYNPNMWYHIAITQKENAGLIAPPTVCLFINGKKQNPITIIGGNAVNSTNTTYWSGSPFFSHNNTKFALNIGNRATSYTGNLVEYRGYKSGQYYLNQPGFQDVIIDDLRITRGELYTNDFTPPGLIGKQILLYDDYAYYIDPDSQDLIKLSFSKWNDISDSDKLILLDRVGYDILPEVEQIKVIQTDPSKPIQYLNYQTDTVKPNIYIDKINSSASQIVYPTKFFDYETIQDYLVNITASGTTTSSSMVRLAVTRDGKDYYTYNLSNREWVPLDNKEDVLNNGIKLADLKNIPKSSWIQFGLSKFAFSIGLYRNTDTFTCQIEDITIHLSLNNNWVKSNTTTQSKYKYIGPTLLRVTFLEEGKYKINYNDRGGE